MIGAYEQAGYGTVPIIEACCRKRHDAFPAGEAYGAYSDDAGQTSKAYIASGNHAV